VISDNLTLLSTAKHWFKDKENTNPKIDYTTKSLDLIVERF